MITLVHFALVFPKPKNILGKHPFLTYVIYGYFLLTCILYLSGIIAFGATFPLFSIWTFIMIGAYVHSFLNEKDSFLKKQIALSLLAPLMVGSIFILLYLLPGVLGITSMGITYFALFSLILPFALPAALDNLSLYHERIEMEKASQREKEQFRQDLHDSILNSFANISLSSEVLANLLEKENPTVLERLKSINELANDSSQELRGFLWITEESNDIWENLCEHLRRHGYDLVKNLDIDFDLNFSNTDNNLKPPPIPVRVCLYQVFREAIANVIKHSHADKVKVYLSQNKDGINFELKDNGIGFDKKMAEDGHYGLKNMKNRVDRLNGDISIETEPDRGTHIRIYFQLS